MFRLRTRRFVLEFVGSVDSGVVVVLDGDREIVHDSLSSVFALARRQKPSCCCAVREPDISDESDDDG